LRVLAVDDSEALGKTLVHVIRRAGHEVSWARTAAEAEAMARTLDVDVVLLDLRLPDEDGVALARRLRKHPATRHARLLALSGDPLRGGRARPFDGFLVKPVRLPELLAAITVTGRAPTGRSR